MNENKSETAFRLLMNSGWPFPARDGGFPEVFIIESLSVEDEIVGNYEGLRLAQTLRLAGLTPKYYYIHDEKELELVVPLFVQSRYRYLHLSCHGLDGELKLKDGTLSCERFAEIFAGALHLRRLFVSACSMGKRDLVDAIHKTSKGAHSVIAPMVEIYFDHAGVIWSSLYVALLERDKGNVQHETILECMRTLVNLYPIANHEDGTKMKFMFAGYDSTKDLRGEKIDPSAWRISEISAKSATVARKRWNRKKGKSGGERPVKKIDGE